MTPLNKFLPFVMPHVPGCSKPLARQMLLLTIDEFCADTDVVQLPLDPINIVADQAEYDVDTPTEQTLNRVLRAWYKGFELSPATPDEVHNVFALRAGFTAADQVKGVPSVFYQQDPNSQAIKLWPIPDAGVTGGLTLRAAFRPTRTAKQVEDVLFIDWLEGIVAGALARLHALPQQPFTDSERAIRNLGDFMRAKALARIQATRGNLRGDVRVRMRPFA